MKNLVYYSLLGCLWQQSCNSARLDSFNPIPQQNFLSKVGPSAAAAVTANGLQAAIPTTQVPAVQQAVIKPTLIQAPKAEEIQTSLVKQLIAQPIVNSTAIAESDTEAIAEAENDESTETEAKITEPIESDNKIVEPTYDTEAKMYDGSEQSAENEENPDIDSQAKHHLTQNAGSQSARYSKENGSCAYKDLAINNEIVYPSPNKCEEKCSTNHKCTAYSTTETDCVLHFNKDPHGGGNDVAKFCMVKQDKIVAPPALEIKVNSAGIRAGNFAKITINGQLQTPEKNASGGTRGFNMFVVNPTTKKVIIHKAYDTFMSSEHLDSALESLPFGSIVAVGVQDEGSRKLSKKAKQFFKDMGSKQISQLGFRQSFAFVGVVGREDMMVENRGKQDKLTAQIEKTFDTKQLKEFVLKVVVESAGIRSGNQCHINVFEKQESKNSRGMNMVVIDPQSGDVTLARTFDTFERSGPMEAELVKIPAGHIIAVGIKDEGTRKLSGKVKQFFKDMGSKEIDQIKYRYSWAFIGINGGGMMQEQVGRTEQDKATTTKVFDGELPKGPPGFQISIMSAGAHGGNFALMYANGRQYNLGKRGISMWVLDKFTGDVISQGVYDTYSRSTNLEKAQKKVPNGAIVVAGVQDEGSNKLSGEAKKWFADMGSNAINKLGFRQGWAFIGVKGQRDFVEESKQKDFVSETSKIFGEIKKHDMTFEVVSKALRAGNMASTSVNGRQYKQNSSRGMNIQIFDVSGSQIWFRAYDTYSNSDSLNADLKRIPNGAIVAMGVKDSAAKNLSSQIRQFFTDMGSNESRQEGFRQSWAFVGVKGQRNMKEMRSPNIKDGAKIKHTISVNTAKWINTPFK